MVLKYMSYFPALVIHLHASEHSCVRHHKSMWFKTRAWESAVTVGRKVERSAWTRLHKTGLKFQLSLFNNWNDLSRLRTGKYTVNTARWRILSLQRWTRIATWAYLDTDPLLILNTWRQKLKDHRSEQLLEKQPEEFSEDHQPQLLRSSVDTQSAPWRSTFHHLRACWAKSKWTSCD